MSRRRAKAAEASARVPRDKRGAIETRLLATWATVCAMLDLGPTAAHNLRKKDPRFPKPLPLPAVREHWSVKELESFINMVIEARDGVTR